MSPTFLTADLFDAHEDCPSCETQFLQYGRVRAFAGPIRTVQCRNDNLLVRRTLETPSQGEVLIVDGEGSLATALMGDMIAELGVKNGWNGIIIRGAIRDGVALGKLAFGVKALGSNPKKSAKTGAGTCDRPVVFGGVTFVPGHWVYSDDDGILVSPVPLI